MGEELKYESLASGSWYYIASLLIIGLFFKFNRFWSIRNLDLVLIVLLAPGVLMVSSGQGQRFKYIELHVSKSTPALMSSESDNLENRNTERGDDPESEGKTGGSTGDGKLDKQSSDAGNSKDARNSKAGESGVNDLENSGGTRIAGSQQDQEKAPQKEVPPDEAIDNSEYLAMLLSERPVDSRFFSDPEFASYVRLERNGYIWLFGIGLLLLVRVLLDSGFTRRPLLEPNLTVGGLVFLGCSLLAFVVIDVAKYTPTKDKTDESGAERMIEIVKQKPVKEDLSTYNRHGPGYALIHILPAIPTFVSPDGKIIGPAKEDTPEASFQLEFITKALAIASQLGVVIAILLIGHWHYGNFNLGVTVATLYLMLPYTAEMAGQVFHVLPALLLVWAIVNYRKPFIAGMMIGLAASVFYYPLFLLPLWFSYYWDRGRVRFLLGFLFSVALVVGSLGLVSQDLPEFFRQLRLIFGFWLPKVVGVQGIWALGWDPWFRLPFLAGFFGLSFSFAFWPIRKNLGTLISCTAAIMLALQFCHGFGGGLYIAWYLPLLLLTVFRPNLDDRIATNEVDEKWVGKKLATASG